MENGRCKVPKKTWENQLLLFLLIQTNQSNMRNMQTNGESHPRTHRGRRGLVNGWKTNQKTVSSFDKELYDKINKEYIELNNNYKENNGTDQHRDGFDREISKDEVEAAIRRLRTGTAPGPDQQFAKFFRHAGEKFTEAIVTMMNIIWQKGEIPTEWKMADVKFLRKPGKTSYYSSSSYRPISLTCVICKLMERVILERIVVYIEGHRLIDLTQEGFRKKPLNNKCVTPFSPNYS
ncbi:unnamed protein product [Mytilus coruscus]|uniref:Reverse transcriptase domain-containing protein n=1 Tax=Mytilus coruscus TaxID=42192 RepID=A0A6J8E6M9_MYTCO|nr:unnamed protein product [Mytilus coruscus]